MIFLLTCLVAFSADPKPSRRSKGKPKVDCPAAYEIAGEDQAALGSLAREHLMDFMGGQMMQLQDTVRKRLMAKRKIESSPALRKEVDRLVMAKILRDAGKEGVEEPWDYAGLTTDNKDVVCRSLLGRLGNLAIIAESKDAPWFRNSGSGDAVNQVNEDFYQVRNSWIDPAKVEAWVTELLGE